MTKASEKEKIRKEREREGEENHQHTIIKIHFNFITQPQNRILSHLTLIDAFLNIKQ
jgi:hypothetical protein